MTIVPDHSRATGDSARVDPFGKMIEHARAGSSTAFGRLMEGCRRYLLLVANETLDVDLRPKGGASDLVQDTFVEAHQDFAQFRGTTEPELLAWLREILIHRIANHTRRYGTQKRDVDREIPLGADSQFEPLNLLEPRVGPADSAMNRDEQALLAAAIARLPEHQREILELRTWQLLSFPEIADRLKITPEAARKQWSRAVRRLQQDLRLDP